MFRPVLALRGACQRVLYTYQLTSIFYQQDTTNGSVLWW